MHAPRCSVGLHGSSLRFRKRTTFDDNFARKARWRSRKWTSKAAWANPKTTKNRPNFALGRSGALGNALGTAPGRAGDGFWAPKSRPGTDLGRPGRATSAWEASKSIPRPVPRRPRTTPEQCLSAFGAPSAVAHACGTIFHLFCVVARKLRCAFRISFNGVFLTSDEISAARAHTATTLENQGVSASKIEPRSVRASQNRARARMFERRNAV